MRRNWRFSSFKVDCAMCLATLTLFACWAIADASFGEFFNPRSYRIINEGGVLETFRPDHFLRYPGFATRVIGLCGLALILLIGFGDIAYRMLRGTANERSVRSMLLTVTLLCLTLGLIVGARQLHDVGLRARVAFALKGFKEDAAILEEKWPTEPGALPYSGSFPAHSNDPPMLNLNSGYWSMTEHAVGVLATDDGGCAFELRSHPDVFVEHHPRGEPKAHKLVFRFLPAAKMKNVEFKLDPVQITEMAPGWFVVQYDIERRDVDGN